MVATKANQRIKQAMRRNEREVLAWVKRNPGGDLYLFSASWYNAFDRLVYRGRVRYNRRKHSYVVVKGGAA